MNGVTELTVSFDMKREEGGRANWPFFAAPNGNEQQYEQEHYIGLLENGGTLTAERFNGGTRAPSIKTQIDTSEWTNITLVYTENEYKLYVDGVLLGTQSSNYTLSSILLMIFL